MCARHSDDRRPPGPSACRVGGAHPQGSVNRAHFIARRPQRCFRKPTEKRWVLIEKCGNIPRKINNRDCSENYGALHCLRSTQLQRTGTGYAGLVQRHKRRVGLGGKGTGVGTVAPLCRPQQGSPLVWGGLDTQPLANGALGRRGSASSRLHLRALYCPVHRVWGLCASPGNCKRGLFHQAAPLLPPQLPCKKTHESDWPAAPETCVGLA